MGRESAQGFSDGNRKSNRFRAGIAMGRGSANGFSDSNSKSN